MAGFNTTIEYKGATFLVQTQDKGPGAPYVESLIYKTGRLLTSKKTFYTSSLSDPNLKRIIADTMEAQHNAVLEDIALGKYDRYL